MPSQLTLEAMDLAGRLVGVPQSRGPAGQAAEREAGYILLGALALALPAVAVAAQVSRPCMFIIRNVSIVAPTC